MAWFSGEIMKYKKINIYWGLLLPFYPGFAISISRDLTEILAICLLTIAFWAFIKNRVARSAIFASLAILARETTLVFTIGFLIFYFYEIIFKNKKSNIKDALFFLIPLATFFLWQLFLFFNWHKFGVGTSISANISAPFLGLISDIKNNNLANPKNIIEIIYLFSVVVASFILIKKSNIHAAIKVCWAVSLIIFSLISANVWVEDITFVRAFSELYFFSFLILLTTTSTPKYIKSTFSILTLFFWFLLARGFIH